MPTITAGRPADADKIHSYDDLVALHRHLAAKVDNYDVDTSAYGEAAEVINRLACLYRTPETLTDEMHATAETVLAAVNKALRSSHSQDPKRGLAIADTWLAHLSMLVFRPTDGR